MSHMRSGSAAQYSRSVRYGAVFNCTGNEDSVEKCLVTVLPLSNCSSDGGEAIVVCSTGV